MLDVNVNRHNVCSNTWIRIKEDYDVRCNLTQFVLKYIYAYVLTFTASTQIVTFEGLLLPFSFLFYDPCPSAFVHLSPLVTHVPSPISSDLYLLVIVPYAVAQSIVNLYALCIAASPMRQGLVPY